MLAFDPSPIASNDYRALLKSKRWTHAMAGHRFGVTPWTSKIWLKKGVPAGPAATVVRLVLDDDQERDTTEAAGENGQASAPTERKNEAAGTYVAVPAQADIDAMRADLKEVKTRLASIENEMSTGLSLKQAVALIRGIQASVEEHQAAERAGTPIGIPDETYFGFDRPDPENAIASVEVQAWQDFYARRARESAGTAAERENKATPSAKDDPK